MVFWTFSRVGRRAHGLEMGWVDDLVSADPVARARAVRTFHQAEDERRRLQRKVNAIWAEAGRPDPTVPHLATRMDTARAEQDQADGYSLLRTLWDGWAWVDWGPDCFDGDPAELVHYSLRYLEWEARFPAEWHRHWGTKAVVLYRLSRRSDLTAADRARLAELVIAAVRREHRCEDQGYALVARAIATESLRERIAAQTRTPDRLTRLRASFLLHLLDHPDQPAKPPAWKRWLAQDQ